jgi:hypothetical protein
MIELDSYWQRKKVEPCRPIGAQWELHMRLAPGTFVQVIGNETMAFIDKDLVNYIKVPFPSFGYNQDDLISNKLFLLYFARVTKENELGLIKLIEQPDS